MSGREAADPKALIPYAMLRCGKPEEMGGCGVQLLSIAQYEEQLHRTEDLWQCPFCNAEAQYMGEESEALQRFQSDVVDPA